jgi:cobalt-zinc-cadmium efflux system protein
MYRLGVVLSLNLALVAALVTVGITARSIAVFAEGGDYLLDAVGVAVAIYAMRLTARQPSTDRPTGRLGANSTAAIINAGWLVALELIVVIVAADRLITGTPHVSGLPVLIVSGVAAVVMTIGAFVLRGDDDDDEDDGDLSVAAVLLDTIADAAAAAGVAITGGIILAAGGLYWLDPAVALAVAVVIGWHAVALIRKVLRRRGGRSADPGDVEDADQFGSAVHVEGDQS